MAEHALAFADAMGLTEVDVARVFACAMVAQEIALKRPSLVRTMLLVGTAPEGGEDIMHLEKPELQRILNDPDLQALQMLVKLFFTSSASSQAAGQAFVARLAERKDWELDFGPRRSRRLRSPHFARGSGSMGNCFAKLGNIKQPCLVVNGVFDSMIPVSNSYFLAEHLPNAMLLTYPDAGPWVAVSVSSVIREAGFSVSRFRKFLTRS